MIEFYFQTKYMQRSELVSIEVRRYPNGSLAWLLSNGAKATISLGDSYKPREGRVLIKDWSENEGILACLVEQGIIRDDGARINSGHVSAAEVIVLHPELLIAQGE